MAFNPVARKQDTTKTKSVPVSQDLIYQAKQMFPGYDDSTAMSLYVMSKAKKQQETDNLQNKLIQTQKTQNEKLTGVVKSLGQELHDFEQQSIETDREVERLKTLAAKLGPAADVQQQTAKASSQELQRLEAKLNSLKSTPGIDKEKFDKLANQVEQMKTLKSTDDSDIQKIEQILDQLQGKSGANDQMFNKAMSELDKTRAQLDAKEERFKAYIQKKSGEVKGAQKSNAEEIKKYSDIVAGYKKEVDSFSKQMQNELDIVRTLRGDLQQELDTVQSQTDEVNSALQFIKQAAGYTDAQNAIRNARQTSQQAPAINQTQQGQQGQQAPSRGLQGLASEYSESVKKKISEDIHISRQWRDPEFTEWMKNNLPVLVRLFKNQYKTELDKKAKAYRYAYSDKQIADSIQNVAQWIDDWFMKNDNKPLTPDAQKVFMSGVRLDLFSEPPEPEQLDMPLSEGIGNIFENMINQIYKKL